MNAFLYLLLLSAGMFLLIAAVMLTRRLKVRSEGHIARARIVDIAAEPEIDDPNSFYYHRVIGYTDHRGIEHKVQLNPGVRRPKWQRGTELDVFYLPDNPGRAYPASLPGMMGPPLTMIAMALVMLGFFAWLLAY
jgi:hypothetical protein